jgi:hypothetical protein
MNISEHMMPEKEIPTPIAEALLKTSLAVGQLGKADENPFGKFKYVSIDKYYENVAHAAMMNDLTWSCKEIGTEIVGGPADKPIMRFTYMFTLIYKDGQCVPGIDVLSIYHGWQGAQTAGSAGSYAEKLFMRKMFKVITGENDADITDPNLSFDDASPKDTPDVVDDLSFGEPSDGAGDTGGEGDLDFETEAVAEVEKESPPEEKPQSSAEAEDIEEAAAIVEEGNDLDLEAIAPKDVKTGYRIIGDIPRPDEDKWEIVHSAFKTFMPEIKKAEGVMQWWNENSVLLDEVEKKAPSVHKKITGLFKRTYNRLEKAEK